MFVASSFLIFVIAIYLRVGDYLLDDGAFFLRYAENMAKGQFWVWNLGEAPIWGASAPLFPLLFAPFIALGFPAQESMIVVSLVVSAVALTVTAHTLHRYFGLVAGLAFVVLCVFDVNTMIFSSMGLETPLTFLLLSLSMWAILSGRTGSVLGVVAGLLVVNKLDLVPAGGLLILAAWLRDRTFPFRAVMISALIVSAWYGFAWLYFGFPLPNSFLTKALHQSGMVAIIDWRWFTGRVFFEAGSWLLSIVALYAVWRIRRQYFYLVVFLVGTMAVHSAAYTIKHPFEPYDWYTMPTVLFLIVLAAIGLGEAAKAITGLVKKLPQFASLGVVAALLALTISVGWSGQQIRQRAWNDFIAYQERDRAEAGKWVDQHTPRDFRVLTSWGNPAFASERYVYDGSYLNRAFEAVDPIAAYQPEIIIYQSNPGTSPMAPSVPASGYVPVKVFDSSYRIGLDYFFVVYSRSDAVDKITDVSTPIDLNSLISNLVVGDVYGAFRQYDSTSFFVHPGETTATSFDVDARGYLDKVKKSDHTLRAAIATLSDDALLRGGGTAKVTVTDGDKVVASKVLRPGFVLNIPLAGTRDKLHFSVTHNGRPDSNRVVLCFDTTVACGIDREHVRSLGALDDEVEMKLSEEEPEGLQGAKVSTSCNIETINGAAPPVELPAGGELFVTGWALGGQNEALPTALYVRLSKEGGRSYFTRVAAGGDRPDVPENLNLSRNLAKAGFNGAFDLGALPSGLYSVDLVIRSPAGVTTCGKTSVTLM